MEINRLAEIEPSRTAPKAKEPGFLRHTYTFIGEEQGAKFFNMGVLQQPPGNGTPSLHTHSDVEEAYFILEGKAAVWTDKVDETVVDQGESVFFATGEPHGYRNAGENYLKLLFVHAGPEEEISE